MNREGAEGGPWGATVSKGLSRRAVLMKKAGKGMPGSQEASKERRVSRAEAGRVSSRVPPE